MLLISALLFAPSLADVEDASPRNNVACAFEMAVGMVADDEDKQFFVTYDPVSDKTEFRDADGQPMESHAQEESDDSGNASFGFTDYDLVRSKLDLPWQQVGDGTYEAEGLDKGTVDIGGLDISKNAVLTMSLAEAEGVAYIERYTAKLQKPMRVKLVAKVREFEQDIRFELVDGQPMPKFERVEGEFSAMGQTKSFRMTADYTYGACISKSDA